MTPPTALSLLALASAGVVIVVLLDRFGRWCDQQLPRRE